MNDRPPIVMLGVPFDNVTTAQTVGLVEQMVASRCPHHLVTANVDFLVQARQDTELHHILTEAHLVLCDGMPLVWASRWLGNPLSERVAGSDLVPLLVKIAAEKKYRVFFLGATPESLADAVKNLRKKHPDLIIAGHYSPPFAPLEEMDHEEIRRRISEAKPDLLFVSLGCPKQEKWIARHFRTLGVPVSVGVGATIDFLAGRAKRAPRWMQRSGLEWIYRLGQEPQRLMGRYARGLWIFGGAIFLQWWRMQLRGAATSTARMVPAPVADGEGWKRVELPARLDNEAVRQNAVICRRALSTSGQCRLDLSRVAFIDSTGMGLLLRMQRQAHMADRTLILLAPSRPVRGALKLMRLENFFTVAK